MHRVIFLAAVWVLAPSCPGGVKPEEVPVFELRARVTKAADEKTDKPFTFQFAGNSAQAKTGEWSAWLKFDKPQIEANLKGYPAIYMEGWPVVVHLSVAEATDPTAVEAELKFAEGGDPIPLTGELYGPQLGILIWRDEAAKPHAATMAQYNKRYWKSLEGVTIPPERRPKKFPMVDRFIGGDNDRRTWIEGIEQLNKAGFSAVMLPPDAKLRKMLLETGGRQTAWAVYNPPGYAFDFDSSITPDSLDLWAKQQAWPYRDAGYEPADMALFAMSDEPGWYYPQMFTTLEKSPAGLARFREYIKSQGLSPADVGAADWEHVLPIGRSKATDLPHKKLFYWTMRFFAHDSARHFAASTAALEKNFYPNLPVLTNWNFFAGRLYVPGPVANNPDKQSPDAAMGGHDWLEFGRMRGSTMLWTEDWFDDSQAYQWSFYCSKLRCAAQKGNVQFGGYVVPRVAGDRADGVVQKVLSIVGSGGKAVKYYVFGPEYTFPGNCYSEKSHVLAKIAEAQTLVGGAEDVLWPGKRPKPQVAILAPRSSQLWDAHALPDIRIEDATNTNLNASTVDYMAEVFNLYLALQHANIPVDFVEEEDLSVAGLAGYRVLYVTEPNIPEENQKGLVEWVKGGGTLATVSGAAQFDRYNEPCKVLSDATGMTEKPRARLAVPNTSALPDVATGSGARGEFTAVGVKGIMEMKETRFVHALFFDGKPAVLRGTLGSGHVIHYAFLPGISYWKSAKEKKDRLPVGFSPDLLAWILFPLQLGDVTTDIEVSEAMVETLLLESPAGAALTLLNWTGEEIPELKITLLKKSLPMVKIESMKRGPLKLQTEGETFTITLPLGAADIVTFKP